MVGKNYYRSEYECEFVDTVESVFLQEQIDAAFKHDFGPWFQELSANADFEQTSAAKGVVERDFQPWFQ